MGYYSWWPAIIIAVAVFVLTSTCWVKAADAPPDVSRSRASSLDGLRGLLALLVFFGHAAIYHEYLKSGAWQERSPLFDLPGEGAVALFFMMTGYLFWGQLLSKNGRPNWISLYISRIFRIGPLYVCAIAMMYLVVVLHTGFHIHDSLEQLIRETTNWLSLGISDSRPDVNGFHNTRVILNGVTWTLFWEWRFYGSLLLLALVARFRKVDLPAVAVVLGAILSYLLLTRTSGMFLSVFATFYLFGMLAASLEKFGLLAPGHAIPKSIAAISLFVLFEVTSKTAYAPMPAILLGCAFYLIISGADLFGILTSRSARRLGGYQLGYLFASGVDHDDGFLTRSLPRYRAKITGRALAADRHLRNLSDFHIHVLTRLYRAARHQGREGVCAPYDRYGPTYPNRVIAEKIVPSC